MRTISVTFESVEDLSVASLFGMHGVYVLWGPKAAKSPSYLGEGLVLSRLNSHVKWLTPAVTGLAATVESKHDAELVEATLLWAADEIGRWPTQNTAWGKWRQIGTLLEEHTSLRVNVRGRHPFVHPDASGSKLRGRAQLSVWLEKGDYCIDPFWNRRG